ncbi:MAG: hypothetical protein LBD78_03465 [Spirochaetaceae bacterium]|nr:hypothetical protein [Spirochaetaceae bacterium]
MEQFVNRLLQSVLKADDVQPLPPGFQPLLYFLTDIIAKSRSYGVAGWS